MKQYRYRPYFGLEEINALKGSLTEKSISVYNNDSVQIFEKKIAELTRHKYAVASNNGTAALHSALKAIGVGVGDEVIVQGVNFISVIYSIIYCGAIPKLADIDSSTLNMEWEQIEPLVNNKTKAIIISNLYGLMADSKKISEKAKQKNIYVIEDLSQCLGAKYNRKNYKIFGDVGFYSFSETKNITTSEGGAIVTDSNKLANRAKIFINLGQIYKGTGKSVYPTLDFSKQIEHREVGFTYRMSPLLAAFGVAQLNKFDAIVEKRKKITEIYKKELGNLSEIILPKENRSFELCYNTYPIQISNIRDTKKLQNLCLANGLPILKAFYCENLYYEILSPYVDPNNFPNSLLFEKNNLVLPIFVSLSLKENERFIKEFVKIIKEKK